MLEKDRQIALKLKHEISKIAPIVDFRVFGSRARGDAEEDSDLDVYLEVKSLDPTLKRKIRHTAWEVGFKHLIVISAAIFSQEEIENSPLRASPLVMNILEEGIAL
ncbi:MAG TPA: nucleotidyltransferase domain-containing protein [bacterium]|jgi:predicted nucleotidyltransferase